MATPRFFSPTNVFIPSATGQIIGYIRTPGQFKLMDYVQLVRSASQDETGKPICAYAVIDPDSAVRPGPRAGTAQAQGDPAGLTLPTADAAWRWAPGDNRPPGNIVVNFRWQTVEMLRRAYSYQYDQQTSDAADLPINQIYRQHAASLAMTVKTDRVIQLLTNVNNWPASNTGDANVINGGKGKWNTASSDPASPNFMAIRLSVQQAAINIVQLTNAAVRPEDLRVLISPNTAMKMGSTSEIYNYVQGSVFSQERQQGRNQLNEQYGMPRYYAGLEFVVEDTPIVLDHPVYAGTPATTNRQWCMPDTSAVMVSRKGGLNGVYGAPSFSTVQIYYYKYELAVEEMTDTWNKLHLGSVVDQFAEVLAATRAGYLITNVT